MEVAYLSPCLVKECFLYDCFVILIAERRAGNHTAQIESSFAVVGIELVECSPTVLVTGLETVVEAESFTLRFLRVNAHHRFYCGIVTSTGVTHHFHLFDVVTFQLAQFRGIAHLASVDINLSRSGAKHIYRAFVSRYAGQFVQQVVARTGFFQDAALHDSDLYIAFDADFGQVCFDFHFTQYLRVGLHLQRTCISRLAMAVYGCITNGSYSQQFRIFRIGKAERAVFAAYCS